MVATFDRDTLLDLLVNVIPLVIIAFFVGAFALFDPFQGDSLGRAIQLLLLLAPFVALAVLTYVSGKAIAGDEKRAEVYHQGQATLPDAEPKHGHEDELEAEQTAEGELEAPADEETTEADEETDTDTEADVDDAETAETTADDTEAAEADETDTEADDTEAAETDDD
ncbi:DUF6684 family protein [Halobaculum sp. MBLA0147]|uniref:DUF6684 family protein n=1 Tax=Halobaculum sp. MBLA0147 TaxID=3079934 RepID=UPI0035251F76